MTNDVDVNLEDSTLDPMIPNTSALEAIVSASAPADANKQNLNRAPEPFCELQGSQKYVFVPAYHHGRRMRAVCACTLQELCKKLLAATSDLPPFPVQNNDVPAGSGAGSQSGQ